MSAATPASKTAPVVIAVGASAGGVEALSRLVAGLPPDLPAAVLVVLHVAPAGTSLLPQILARASLLDVHSAVEGEQVLAGHVYVAPPDHHLVVDGERRIRLTRGPRENGHRPAVDVTFRSVAAAYDSHAVGVVLSGTRDDGTAGLGRMKAAGARALVQDPVDALYDGMPRNAMQHVAVDAALNVEDLVQDAVLYARAKEHNVSARQVPAPDLSATGQPSEPPTRYTCPECGGMLMRHDEGGVDQLRCSVGHVYSTDTYDGEQGRIVEGALWAGARLLDDRATFLGEMAERATAMGHGQSAATFRQRAREEQQRADALRNLVARPETDAGAVEIV